MSGNLPDDVTMNDIDPPSPCDDCPLEYENDGVCPFEGHTDDCPERGP